MGGPVTVMIEIPGVLWYNAFWLIIGYLAELKPKAKRRR
jgi:hypothetical protein